MPRKKITISEALETLEKAGLRVKVEAVKEEVKHSGPDIYVSASDDKESKPIKGKVGNTTIKLSLYSKHSISSGGSFVAEKDGGTKIQDAGVVTYGPGVCYVPLSVAQHLLRQDQLARQTDERMLEKTQRSYIIAQRVTDSGIRNVGLRLSDEYDFNTALGNLPDSDMYIIR